MLKTIKTMVRKFHAWEFILWVDIGWEMKHIRGSLVFGIVKEQKHLDLHYKGGLIKATVNHPCMAK